MRIVRFRTTHVSMAPCRTSLFRTVQEKGVLHK